MDRHWRGEWRVQDTDAPRCGPDRPVYARWEHWDYRGDSRLLRPGREPESGPRLGVAAAAVVDRGEAGSCRVSAVAHGAAKGVKGYPETVLIAPLERVANREWSSAIRKQPTG